jgi:putative membrane protein
MMWGYSWGFSWMGWALMVSLWLLLGSGFVWLVRARSEPRNESQNNARRVLDERFAAGEITASDYESRRRILR